MGKKNKSAKPAVKEVLPAVETAKEEKEEVKVDAVQEIVPNQVEEPVEAKKEEPKKETSKEQPQQKQRKDPKQKVVPSPEKEAESVNTEIIPNVSRPATLASGVLRMSPDSMVSFSNRVYDMHVRSDSEQRIPMTNAICVIDAYLLSIISAQIQEDSSTLGLTINSVQLNALQDACKAIGVNITKALPSAENPAQTHIEFDPETMPKPLQEKMNAEEKISEKELDFDPSKKRTQKEIEEVLISIFNKRVENRTPSGNLCDALNWYHNHLICSSPEDKTVASMKIVDQFATMMECFSKEMPVMLNGILRSVWNRYANNETILPAHLMVKKVFGSVTKSEEDVADLVTFILNVACDPKDKRTTNRTEISNPELPFLEERVKQFIRNTAARDFSMLTELYEPVVYTEGKVSFDRVGSVAQGIVNMYLDQSKQAKRLSLYKDLSEYSVEEKKN